MNDALVDRLTGALGSAPRALEPLGGGCVGEVYRARMTRGPDAVVKVDRSPEPRLDVEGGMLAYLAEHSSLPVPRVLLSSPGLLVMEFVETSRGTGRADLHAADCLASLHEVVSPDGRFGFDRDTLIGGLHQPNPWTGSWLDFFRDQRLLFMAREASRAGRLPDRALTRAERLAERLDRWIDPAGATPSLIHGDVWGGNVLTNGDRVAAFIDPAIYHADPEIELAFTTLFSTFSEAFYRRYAEHRPIAEGFFEQRRDLYNLYPLLVHVRLFGGTYVGSVENTLRRFGV